MGREKDGYQPLGTWQSGGVPSSGSQLAENSAHNGKSTTQIKIKIMQPGKFMVIISWEFFKQRPKRDLPMRNTFNKMNLKNPQTVVKLYIAKAFFYSFNKIGRQLLTFSFQRAEIYLVGSGKWCPLGLYYILHLSCCCAYTLDTLVFLPLSFSHGIRKIGRRISENI